MRDVSTKQAALTVIGFTVVLAAVLYLATFFKAFMIQLGPPSNRHPAENLAQISKNAPKEIKANRVALSENSIEASPQQAPPLGRLRRDIYGLV